MNKAITEMKNTLEGINIRVSKKTEWRKSLPWNRIKKKE